MPSMVYRATFIHVDIGAEEDLVADRFRAQTMPCLPVMSESADFFRGEREYVADLDARFASLDLETDDFDSVYERGILDCFDLDDDFGRGPAAWAGDAFGSPPPPLEETEAQRCNRLVMSALLGAKLWDCDGGKAERKTIMDAETRAPSSDCDGGKAERETIVDAETRTPPSTRFPSACSPACLNIEADDCAQSDVGEWAQAHVHTPRHVARPVRARAAHP